VLDRLTSARGAEKAKMDLPFIDWTQVLSHFVSIAIAYMLALPIGWDRELAVRSAGLRTFPLVAVASCGYILVAKAVLGDNAESQARVIQGLITGIGFIGGGAILKEGGSVHGTTTAVSIWITGAVSVAVAYRRYEIALIAALINFATLRLLTPLEHRLRKRYDQKRQS
jgi:putative Mg2+ transporter-C (MgtC) family protein